MLLLVLGLTLFLVHSDWLHRWDQLLYDAQLRLWSRPPPADIVLIAIDDASLTELGRWPWPRRYHAEVIAELSEAGARAIVMDILFAESSRRDPEADAVLARAMAESGRVFLPVLIEELRLGGQLLETLPLPELAEAAAGLGHVHIQLDADGIARSVYLFEGIRNAYWPHIALSLLRWLEPGAWQDLPGERNTEGATGSPYYVVRDHHVLVPFAGPPGHFPRLSYAQVLRGEFSADSVRDKLVLVGVTATGLGDTLPTPLSSHRQPMSGAEINANIIDGLRRNIAVESVTLPWRLLLSGTLVLVPFLLFPFLAPRFALLTTVLVLMGTVAVSGILLHAFRLWFPPSPALLGLALSYPLWSWRRLERTMRYLKQELDRLHGEPKAVPFYARQLDIGAGLTFLERITPLGGWLLLDQSGNVLSQHGEQPRSDPGSPTPNQWRWGGQSAWTAITRDADTWYLGLHWGDPNGPTQAQMMVLKEFTAQFESAAGSPAGIASELVETRIRQVQAAYAELRTMRQLISDTLGQMEDGLLVVNAAGRVVMANPSAARHLGQPSEADMNNADTLTLLETFEIPGGTRWPEIFGRVLVDQQSVRFEAGDVNGAELFIQVAPLSMAESARHGMIINISDVRLLKESERKRAEALSFLSHDLRSPITSLLSLVQGHQPIADETSWQELTRRVEQYAKKALHMAENFLQLARAENLDSSAFAETDLVTIAHNALDESYPGARAKGIRLVRRMGVDELWVRADAGLLERAFLNLLSNAIKYGPDGSRIEFHLHAEGKEVQCCIRDQGPGIPPDQTEKIFVPFHRIKDGQPRRRDGTGLGLAFVRLVAEKHGGRIEATNMPEGGACFCLRLSRPRAN